MPARKKPQHRVTISYEKRLVPGDESLVLEHDAVHEVTVLGAVEMGPDTLFTFVTTRHEAPDA